MELECQYILFSLSFFQRLIQHGDIKEEGWHCYRKQQKGSCSIDFSEVVDEEEASEGNIG